MSILSALGFIMLGAFIGFLLAALMKMSDRRDDE